MYTHVMQYNTTLLVTGNWYFIQFPIYKGYSNVGLRKRSHPVLCIVTQTIVFSFYFVISNESFHLFRNIDLIKIKDTNFSEKRIVSINISIYILNTRSEKYNYYMMFLVVISYFIFRNIKVTEYDCFKI